MILVFVSFSNFIRLVSKCRKMIIFCVVSSHASNKIQVDKINLETKLSAEKIIEDKFYNFFFTQCGSTRPTRKITSFQWETMELSHKFYLGFALHNNWKIKYCWQCLVVIFTSKLVNFKCFAKACCIVISVMCF